MRRYSRYGVVIVTAMASSMIAGTRLLAQTSPQSKNVVVEVLPDYPAFSRGVTPSGRVKPEIRAIIVRQDPTDALRSLIIVNPLHVTPETVYDALRLLRSSGESNGGANLIVVTRPSDGPSNTEELAAVAELRPFVANILAREASQLPGHRGLGRFAVVSESFLSEHFGTTAK
jgi:hypothetical protein